MGHAGKKWAIAKLRPKMEPSLKKQGLLWEDVLPALELVDSVEELQAAAEDPEGFLKSMAKTLGPAGKKWAIAKLPPKMEHRRRRSKECWMRIFSSRCSWSR